MHPSPVVRRREKRARGLGCAVRVPRPRPSFSRQPLPRRRCPVRARGRDLSTLAYFWVRLPDGDDLPAARGCRVGRAGLYAELSAKVGQQPNGWKVKAPTRRQCPEKDGDARYLAVEPNDLGGHYWSRRDFSGRGTGRRSASSATSSKISAFRHPRTSQRRSRGASDTATCDRLDEGATPKPISGPRPLFLHIHVARLADSRAMLTYQRHQRVEVCRIVSEDVLLASYPV